MRKFYANLEEKVKDKVFVGGKVTMTSEAIKKLIRVHDHEGDDYSV